MLDFEIQTKFANLARKIDLGIKKKLLLNRLSHFSINRPRIKKADWILLKMSVKKEGEPDTDLLLGLFPMDLERMTSVTGYKKRNQDHLDHSTVKVK